MLQTGQSALSARETVSRASKCMLYGCLGALLSRLRLLNVIAQGQLVHFVLEDICRNVRAENRKSDPRQFTRLLFDVCIPLTGHLVSCAVSRPQKRLKTWPGPRNAVRRQWCSKLSKKFKVCISDARK